MRKVSLEESKLLNNVNGTKTIGLSPEQKKEYEQKARNGDVIAFTHLLEHYRPRLEGMAYRYCRDYHISQDLVSETNERAWRYFPMFRGGSQVWTWIYRIAINVCNTYLDKNKRKPYTTSSSQHFYDYEDEDIRTNQADLPIQDPSESVAAIRSSSKIENAYNDMSEEMRHTWDLFEQEGLKYKEIAIKLDIPIGTVRSRLYNAREHLAKSLDDFER